MYYLGNVEMLSLYEYNNVAKMKVSIYDLGALWKNGCSPFDKLCGRPYQKPQRKDK